MTTRLWAILLVPLLGLGLQACGPNPLAFMQPSSKSQDDCGFVQNVYGQRISWKGQTPIQLFVHESVPQQYYPALDSAIRHWEQTAGKPLFQVISYGAKGPLAPRQDGVSTIYYMPTWEDNRASEQARTSVYWVGDVIREADIRINARNFTFYVQQPSTGADVHMESLLIHELGHVLGLKHKDSGSSVMSTYLAAVTDRSTISATDATSLKCEY